MTNFIVTYEMSVYDSFEGKNIRNKHFEEFEDEETMNTEIEKMKKYRDMENIKIFGVKKYPVEGK